MKKLMVFFLLTISTFYAQQFKVSGTVLNSASGDPLPFANIVLKGTNIGATTNANGFYELTLEPGNYQLLVSHIGYKTETITISIEADDILLNIRLTSTDIILQEVSVYAAGSTENQAVSSITLQSNEMKKITSVFPDVFRSIQSLPGITANNEFNARYNVHGGNYDENLVLVNGTQVYEPFHIKEAENASIGIFNMDMMKKVNLITGGFSAQYGDRLSSVLNIEYREGNKEKFTGFTTLSMTSLDGIVEGPFLSRGSFILGFRKSYVEYVLNMIGYKEDIDPNFYDIQGVLTYNISDIDKLQIKFIHAGDDFRLQPKRSSSGPFTSIYTNSHGQLTNWVSTKKTLEDNKANYYSNLFDIQNTLFLSNNILVNTSLSYYGQIDREDFYYTDMYLSDITIKDSPGAQLFYNSYFESILKNNLDIKTIEGKNSIDFKVNPFYDLKTGLSCIGVSYKLDLVDKTASNIKQNYESFPDTLTTVHDDNFNTFPQRISVLSYKVAGYIENVIQLSNNFIMNLGGRFDYFDFNRDLTYSPRLNLSYKIGYGINLRGAWGHYYQSPIYRQLEYPFEVGINTQSQKSEQFILSIEKNTSFNSGSNSLTVKLEGYYKKYSALISSTRSPSGRIEYSRKNDSRGFAKGIDFYASLKLLNYYGWLSYGLLFAKEDLLTDNLGEAPRYTDQRHTLSFVNDFDLGKNWSINFRFTYGSGFAYTQDYLRYNNDQRKYEWIKAKQNSEYLPAYKRFDLRINKEFTFFDTPAQAFLDISNLFNFKNVMSFSYRYDNNGYPYREENELWPIVPSLGLTIKF